MLQKDFLMEAGLPYEPLDPARVDPAAAAHEHGPAAAEKAEALQVRLMPAAIEMSEHACGGHLNSRPVAESAWDGYGAALPRSVWSVGLAFHLQSIACTGKNAGCGTVAR